MPATSSAGTAMAVLVLRVLLQLALPLADAQPSEVGGVFGLVYGGWFYRTLDGTGPSAALGGGVSGHSRCQSGAIAIPDGCELMPDEADLRTNVIAPYCWGTHGLHTAGESYWGSWAAGTSYGPPGESWRSNENQSCSGRTCSVSGCSRRILAKCSYDPSPPPCAAGTAGEAGSCADCAAGRHQPSAEQETCIACVTGRYQNAAGSSAAACIACGAGSYRGSEAGTAANQCITW